MAGATLSGGRIGGARRQNRSAGRSALSPWYAGCLSYGPRVLIGRLDDDRASLYEFGTHCNM